MCGRLIREEAHVYHMSKQVHCGICFIPQEKAHAEMDHSRYSSDYDVRRLC